MTGHAIQLALEWPGTDNQLHMVNDREQIRAMEQRTYDCGGKREFHPPHPRDDGTGQCPGLVSRHCGEPGRHTHHRWAEPDTFFWCHGLHPDTTWSTP